MSILCMIGFHKKRNWCQWVKRHSKNGLVIKRLVAEGCKCDRCGKTLWRKDYKRSKRRGDK